MKSENIETSAIKEFFFKTVLIAQSVKAINDNWAKDIIRSIHRHIFTDPINVELQTDEQQVEYFNKLFGTSSKSIQWVKKIDSTSIVDITADNKEEIAIEVASKIYSLLSVAIFENLIEFLKVLNKKQNGTSEAVIKLFGETFKQEIENIDSLKQIKTPMITIMNNLRLCRNVVTHNSFKLSALESKFKKEGIELELFCFKPNTSVDVITLDRQSFIRLVDLYSQLAYLAYLCFCDKNKINVVAFYT
ncbi:hypothetical protein RYH73_14895 [Olivibacter sp. CPCC 100613]|uniref:hypothetical protein n=1 Tax=Olivibacter sp. CPCC 100613 TaxID=3079931 RepID=UPI002FFC4991